jgi:hypothetical protein
MIVKPDRLLPEEYYRNTDLQNRKASNVYAPAQISVNPEWPNSTNYIGFLSPKCYIYRFETFHRSKLEVVV